MDKIEANEVIDSEIEDLRKKPYDDLVKIMNNYSTKEVESKSGKVYQVQLQVFWDDKEDENLRVSVAIDDDGWAAFFPLTSNFIISPKGEFIGE